MQKITPFLCFEHQAEDAMNFYTGIFKNAKVISINRYGKNAPMPEGSVMTTSFELFGQHFIALNAGPMFQFTPAVSFLIDCDTQDEVDYYWDKLSADPQSEACGWLKDKFGVSWQVVPGQLLKLISDPDAEKSGRVMQAMMQMKKIDIAVLQRVADAS